jgi:hypothetical protein
MARGSGECSRGSTGGRLPAGGHVPCSKPLPGPSVSRVTRRHPFHRKANRQGKTGAHLCVARESEMHLALYHPSPLDTFGEPPFLLCPSAL